MTTPPQIPKDDKEITLRLVLSHIQYHAIRLDQKIDLEVGSVKKELKDFRQDFNEFAHGVDDLDDRVQDIENENLSKRMKRVEHKIGMAA